MAELLYNHHAVASVCVAADKQDFHFQVLQVFDKAAGLPTITAQCEACTSHKYSSNVARDDRVHA